MRKNEPRTVTKMGKITLTSLKVDRKWKQTRAALILISSEKIIFAKGYGYGDVTQRKPIVADQTLFNVASLSKLFVWTAVMQRRIEKVQFI